MALEEHGPPFTDRLPTDIVQRQLWKRALATLAARPDAAYSEFKSDVIILRDAHRTFGVYHITTGDFVDPTDEDRTESELAALAAERGDDDEWEA